MLEEEFSILEWLTKLIECGIDSKQLFKDHIDLKKQHDELLESNKKTWVKLEDENAHLRYERSEAHEKLRQ